jgi:cytochrome c biogenesis protein CcmG/thiol:disulfide interchange protein DsbE
MIQNEVNQNKVIMNMKKIIYILVLFPLILSAQNISRFSIQDVQGNNYRLKGNLNHDANIMIFWATWCKPCKLEFPNIQKLIDAHKNIDIHVLAVSIDSPRSLAKVKAFVRTQKYDFTYLLDKDGDLKSNLLVNAIPHTFIINSEGNIVYSHLGFREGDETVIEDEILKLVKNLDEENK